MSSKHLSAFFALLPRGKVYPSQGENSTLEKLFDGLGLSLDDFDSVLQEQIDDILPDGVGNYLEEWERVFDLPPVGITGLTAEQRRDAVVTMFSLAAESSPDFFVQLAAGFGYTINVTDPPFTIFTAGSPAGENLTSEALNYVWKVEVTGLASQDIGLENLISLFKPAHTYPIFEYLG